jgi:hypothetical protein
MINTTNKNINNNWNNNKNNDNRNYNNRNNTNNNDPNALRLGITFDHRYEIQPKAIFVAIDIKGMRNLGIIFAFLRVM